MRWIDDCCQPAVDELNNLGVKTTQSKKTIGKWNRDFRKHEKFPHPNVHVRMGKKPKPPIFELYPHLEATVGEFVIKHLDFFTVEMLRSELVTEMIPKLVKECEDAKEEDSLGYKLLQTYMDKAPSYSTILRWVHIMGYNYSTKSKSYMVDGHEHKPQREHRDKLTAEYITVLETRCHRWIQMLVEEFQERNSNLEEGNKILNTGYTYDAINGEKMIELHVDDHECLQEYANEKYKKFGGNLSVRMSGKPIIIIGQDESVYNQFAFGSKQWVGQKGERAFLPKSDGMGVMVSAMQSREFGWGMVLTADQLKDINAKRARDIEYYDKEASKDVLGTTKKKILQSHHSFASWSMVQTRRDTGRATT